MRQGLPCRPCTYQGNGLPDRPRNDKDTARPGLPIRPTKRCTTLNDALSRTITVPPPFWPQSRHTTRHVGARVAHTAPHYVLSAPAIAAAVPPPRPEGGPANGGANRRRWRASPPDPRRPKTTPHQSRPPRRSRRGDPNCATGASTRPPEPSPRGPPQWVAPPMSASGAGRTTNMSVRWVAPSHMSCMAGDS